MGTREMEGAAIVVAIVSNAHACFNTYHSIAQALGFKDPSKVWVMDLSGSDTPFLLMLTLVVVFRCSAAAYLLGGPYMRLASTNLLLFALIVLVAYSGKRSSEIQARLLHLSYLRDEEMRFQAEFSSACLQDRTDVAVEPGSHMGGSSYFQQLLDDVRPDCGGVLLAGGSRCAGGSQCMLPAAPSAPAWFGPAAAWCVAEARDEATHQCSFCLPLDAGVWVEGRASTCALRDLERGQRVLCYDSLGRSIRYVEVLEKRADFGEVPCVGGGLGDRTQLGMTADQPVQLPSQREVVQAADLSLGKDSVVVHEVARQAEARGARGRAHLVVRHPDGRFVLVARRVMDVCVPPRGGNRRAPAAPPCALTELRRARACGWPGCQPPWAATLSRARARRDNQRPRRPQQRHVDA
ncbi:unnamed protein product [Prorocentrum cordatum]|uniref:Uncharacterized protein n=1 Tax=Prorocentrum cordatum TaxID=2364126 RepID=A0ABN9VT88_9DINO|nr:unnamed protein product [Polarella glacialis]